MKILILGGYGSFGGRLVQLLADEPRLTLIVAGRSLPKATACCAGIAARARLEPMACDRDGDIAAMLDAAAPDLVVDASGPFQNYGADPYRVVRAALARGIDYLDLADGAEFVAGIDAFDAAARERGVFVLAGASTYPVLTAAAVRRLAHGMERIETIAAGIAPSPYAALGANVIRAIASYAGQPVQRRDHRGRREGEGIAFVETRRYTIAPPGRVPLGNRRFSLVDAPDLAALPLLWPELRSVWVGVAPVPEIFHRALNALALLVHWRWLPSFAPLAPLLHRANRRLRWGEHRGGMFVAITGRTRDGRYQARSWHLLADGDDGPFIPAMAAAAIIGGLLAGRGPRPGARAALRDLELADYEALFATRAIATGCRDDAAPKDGPLYRRLLGEAWALLPPPLQRLHDLVGAFAAAGIATVERGTNPLARVIAAIMGFPPAGRDIPVRVSFRAEQGGELWRRDFAGRRFASRQAAGRGRHERLLIERFGPLAFRFALAVEGDRLRLVPRGWSAFGLPLPRWAAPSGDAYEFAAAGRFHFHVEIRLPLIGRIVHYRGWLEPV
jgi:hypothetical protein